MPKLTLPSINTAAKSKVFSCMTVPFLLVKKNPVSSKFHLFHYDYGHVLGQKTLDWHLVSHVPTFTKSGLTDYIIEMVVSEDEVSHLLLLIQYLFWFTCGLSSWWINLLSTTFFSTCNLVFLSVTFLIALRFMTKFWTIPNWDSVRCWRL